MITLKWTDECQIWEAVAPSYLSVQSMFFQSSHKLQTLMPANEACMTDITSVTVKNNDIWEEFVLMLWMFFLKPVLTVL